MNELKYDLYLVINNQKEKITFNDDSLNFDIKLPANEIKNGYLELIVKDSYYEVVIKSNSFTVQSSQMKNLMIRIVNLVKIKIIYNYYLFFLIWV